MADVITRLKVESTEYDSKIKRASQGLLQMEQACRKVGGTLAILEKDELEFVKGLGKMETVSKDARGQLNELTKAFTDLSLQYKRLTDEEKQGDFGKALASSLGELKTRIQDTKGQLSEINGEINGGGGLTGALDQLAGKFGMNIQQLAGWGAAIGAAKVALDVAKDAFLSSESNIDEWGRTCKGAEIAYDQLLQSLNQGSWSNFFKNISDAYEAGVNLYNVLDRMGSVRANNQFAISESEANLAELRVQLKKAQNAKDEALADTLKKQILALEKSIKGLKQQNVGATRNAGIKSVETILNSSFRATTGGRVVNMATVEKFIQDYGKSGQKVFDNASKVVSDLEAKGTRTVSSVISKGTTSTGMSLGSEIVKEDRFDIKNLTEAEQYQYAWAKAIKERETALKEATAILVDSNQQRQSIAQQEFQVQRWTGAGGSGGSGGGSKSGGGGSASTVAKELNPMQQAQKEISALTEEALTADEARRKVIKEEIADLQKQVEAYKQIQDYVTGKGTAAQVSEAKVNKPLTVDEMRAKAQADLEAQNTAVDSSILSALLKDSVKSGVDVGNLLDSANLEIQAGIDVPDETWQAILDKYNELREQIGEEPITIDFNTGKIAEDGKKADKTWKDAASAVQSVGSAFSQIEDPAAKAMGTVMQAIASIALGFAQASAQAGSMGPWAWLAFLAAGAAATATTISTIHSLTGFAEGGIVPGNNFSGDNLHTVDYGINSGELILNRSQQSTIASALMDADNARGGYAGAPYVTGEKIVLGINNYARRSGRGELVFSK